MDRKKKNNYNEPVVSFNGEPLKDDEVLAPVVLNGDMKTTLKRKGLNYNYCNTVRVPGTKKRTAVAHVPVNKEDYKIAKTVYNQYLKICAQNGELNKFEEDMYALNKEINSEYNRSCNGEYPNNEFHEESYKSNYYNTCFSYDGLMKDIDEEDGNGYDPSADFVPDDKENELKIIRGLCDDLKEIDPESANIIQMLLDGYKRKEVVGSIGKSNTQSYETFNKALEVLKQEYEKSLKD